MNNNEFCPRCCHYIEGYPYGGICKYLTQVSADGWENTMKIFCEGKVIENVQICVGTGFSCNNFSEK